jgi:hypothetical protein
MLPIFVSSTFVDLEDHRASVREIIRQIGAVDIAMEHLGACCRICKKVRAFPSFNSFETSISFLFLIPVQKYVNAVNERRIPGLPFYRWSSGHIVCLVFGIIIWAVLSLGLGAE